MRWLTHHRRRQSITHGLLVRRDTAARSPQVVKGRHLASTSPRATGRLHHTVIGTDALLLAPQPRNRQQNYRRGFMMQHPEPSQTHCESPPFPAPDHTSAGVWSERTADFLQSDSNDGPHPVCSVHLAFIPCRHGSAESPCVWRIDKTSRDVVFRFHDHQLSRRAAVLELNEAVLEGEQ